MHNHLLRSPIISLCEQRIWARKHLDKQQLWQKGEVVGQEGNKIVDVKLDSGQFQRFHTEQTKPLVEPMREVENFKANEAYSQSQTDDAICGNSEVQTDGKQAHDAMDMQETVATSRPRRTIKAPNRLTYS